MQLFQREMEAFSRSEESGGENNIRSNIRNFEPFHSRCKLLTPIILLHGQAISSI